MRPSPALEFGYANASRCHRTNRETNLHVDRHSQPHLIELLRDTGADARHVIRVIQRADRRVTGMLR